MNNITYKTEDKLFEKFISLLPNISKGDLSISETYSSSVDEIAESLLSSPYKELTTSNLKEILAKQANISFIEALSEQDMQLLYLKYIDFIVDIKRKLIIADKTYRHMFMLKPSYSPSVEAYEEVGYNKLEISPSLSTYAIVS